MRNQRSIAIVPLERGSFVSTADATAMVSSLGDDAAVSGAGASVMITVALEGVKSLARGVEALPLLR